MIGLVSIYIFVIERTRDLIYLKSFVLDREAECGARGTSLVCIVQGTCGTGSTLFIHFI